MCHCDSCWRRLIKWREELLLFGCPESVASLGTIDMECPIPLGTFNFTSAHPVGMKKTQGLFQFGTLLLSESHEPPYELPLQAIVLHIPLVTSISHDFLDVEL
jgi:hypothetical protein